ncbi:MAG: FAD-binding protein, partial [Woeseiaceae bacterium]
AREAGFDPKTELLPVTSAAHYHMGGVQTDQAGRTSIDGLWACGEVATTGIHGANRLASNSLLEGLVYAQRVARDVRLSRVPEKNRVIRIPELPAPVTEHDEAVLEGLSDVTRKTMSDYVGISRSAAGLESALSTLSELEWRLRSSSQKESESLSYDERTRWSEVRNLILVARLVTLAALQREESRGAHYRDDFPGTSPAWQRRQKITIGSLGSEPLSSLNAPP